jgi:ankyrin repeat protein
VQLFGRLESLGRQHPPLALCAYPDKLELVTHAIPKALDFEPQGGHRDLMSALSRGWSSHIGTLREISQVSRDGRLSPIVLQMLHLASNNLLSEEQASNVMESLLQNDIRSLFSVVMAEQSPATKAIARSLLPSAIKSADVSMVRSLLNTGINPDSYTMYSHERPLQLAASVGCSELTRLLLHHGAHVNLPCAEGSRLPLTTAVRNGWSDIVRLLVEARVDVNATSTTGKFGNTDMTALQAAALADNPEILRLLLDAGADMNAPAYSLNGPTALELAVESGNTAVVELLLSRGARTNTHDVYHKKDMELQAATSAVDLGLLALYNHLPLEWGASDILTAMDHASKRGHIQVVQALLSFGEGLDATWHEARKRTALKAGSQCGDYEFVRNLLNSGVDVNAPAIESDTQWTTALQIAAREGNIDIVQLLCAFGADVNAPAAGECGSTALQGAAYTGKVELVRFLLSAGADVNPNHLVSHESALFAAASSDSLDVVQLLLDFGADISKQGKGALEVAINRRCSLELVRFLLELTCANNSEGSGFMDIYPDVLMVAGDVKLIQLLLDYEVLSIARAFGWAIEYSKIECVKLFLQSGANVNDQFSDGVHNFGLVTAAISGDLNMMYLLFEHGANVKEKSRALQGAACANQIKAVQLLVNSKADVNAAPLGYLVRDLYLNTDRVAPPRTALQAAAGTGNIRMVRLLLDAGADVESKVRDEIEQGTALQFAAMAGSISVASELIKNGADVNAPASGDDGRTALEGAAEHGRLDMVQLLLNVEAEIRGSRAVRFAQREDHVGVVQSLLENGFQDVGDEFLHDDATDSRHYSWSDSSWSDGVTDDEDDANCSSEDDYTGDE